jgi:hypothetical protein
VEILPITSPSTKAPYSVEFSPEVLEKIRLAVARAYLADPRGGPEVGGILFGRRNGNTIVLTDSALFEAEHSSLTSFHVSQRDQARIVDALESSVGADSQPVGWFHSLRGELSFTQGDLQVHRRFFPERWHTLLLVKPDKSNPIRASFFFPNCQGALLSGRAQEFVLQQARLPLAPETPPPPPPVAEIVEQPAPVHTEPPAPPPPAPKVDEPRYDDEPAAFDSPPQRRWIPWALGGLVIVVAGGAAAAYESRHTWLPRLLASTAAQSSAPAQPAQTPQPPHAIRLVTIEEEGQLQILWDPSLPVVQTSYGGTLSITEEGTTETFPLDPTHLQTGTFTYARQTDRVEVKLNITRPDAPDLVQATTYISKRPLPKAESAAGKSADTAKLRADLASQSRRIERLQQALEKARRDLAAERRRRTEKTP